MSASSIAALLTDAPFEVSTITALENYVSLQKSRSQGYDFNANKALLKAYQCNSRDIVNAQVVADVLVMGLMRLPDKDFFELSYLIPTKLLPQNKVDKSDEAQGNVAKVSVVTKCADMLERARYAEFWSELASNEAASAAFSMPGCSDAIRAFILNNTASAFRNIKRTLLFSLLGFSDNAAAGAAFLAASAGVNQAVSTGDVVSFVLRDAAATAGGASKKASDLGMQVGDILQLVESIRGSN
jgi:hypothetical protein